MIYGLCSCKKKQFKCIQRTLYCIVLYWIVHVYMWPCVHAFKLEFSIFGAKLFWCVQCTCVQTPKQSKLSVISNILAFKKNEYVCTCVQTLIFHFWGITFLVLTANMHTNFSKKILRTFINTYKHELSIFWGITFLISTAQMCTNP